MQAGNAAKCPAHMSCLPTVVPATDSPAADGVEPEDVAAATAEFQMAFDAHGSGEIQMAQREVLGWACSYRKSQPEQASFEKWCARWSKSRLRYADQALQAPRFRRLLAEQAARQAEWRRRRNIVG